MKTAEICEQIAQRITFELICSSGLPGEYRRSLLWQELATMGGAAADDFLERVLGRLDDDDPLVVLMMGGQP